ncbi:MAG: hypothetical protein AMXMBFR78_19290 [Rubrivivax sp.]
MAPIAAAAAPTTRCGLRLVPRHRPLAEFDILYGEGISREGEIIDMGVQARVVDKAGAWYAYNGEKIGQGKDNAREFLRENADLAREIENKVRESLGVPLLAAEAQAQGERGEGA